MLLNKSESFKVKLLVSTLCLLRVTQCGWAWGTCPQTSLQQNFDQSQYIGRWYEQFRDIAIPYESGECVQAHYTPLPDGTI